MNRRIALILAGFTILVGVGVFLTILWTKNISDARDRAREDTVATIKHEILVAGNINEIRITTNEIRAEIAKTEEEARIAAEEEARRKAEEEEQAAIIAAQSTEVVLPTFATLQEVIDYWVNNYRHGAVSIEIFDLDQGVVVASYNATAAVHPRSIYKLFYAYDAYAQIDAGIDDPNMLYLGDYTLGYCLDIMIRYSNNPCAEAMLDDSARLARVSQLIKDLGLYSTQPNALISSAHDVSLLLQHYYVHPDWTEATWQKFRETALNQSYTYRKGLPNGFSVATVYNKTGFGGAEYNDAAIVEFPNGASYIVVVMTTNTSYANIATLGSLIEKTVLANS